MTSSDIASSREPEHVIMARMGSVLGRKTILKSDHFPGCQNKRLQPQVQGAPNFRQAGSLPVYGVAIPTIEGIRRVLDIIGANRQGGLKHVLWHNLREEPVIYINGRPFVLREVERPFTNLEYTGIDRIRVEQMEARLKEDVLQEAGRFGSKILVCDEMPDGQMIDQWEPIHDGSVRTPLEVYNSLSVEAYSVEYERVPITDEKSPKERDFDLLVQRVSTADIDTIFVFNCQMGRGRTTTGMVIATLVHLKRTGSAGIRRSRSFGLVLSSAKEIVEEVPDSEEDFKHGEYTPVRSLCRVLEGGIEGKRQVDTVIDKCSAMQNLREAINVYRNSILRQADEKKRESALSYFVEYLERYYFLICFAVYIHTDQSALTQPGGFQQWMKARPELYSIIRRLLRRDPMGALGYRTKIKRAVVQKTYENGRPSTMEAVVAARNGHVLGRQTVLKSDHYPGCHHNNLSERIEGAPNFREIPGFPVYGVANPTVDGVRAVLQRVGGRQGGCPVLWHNMREEPVVYINGKPFVLREVERPFKNMLEYTGIDRDRVEQMEARLKEDVLKEAEQYNGAIMVNHETEDGQIFDAWEPVTPDAVQTPVDVFSRLLSEGFEVQYARMPITDGKAPKSSDFDALTSRIASAPKNTIFVFNCQMGRGRTTTGTVIACLVKLRCDYGKPLRMPTSLPGASAGESESSGDEAAEVHSIPVPDKLERSKSGILVMDDIPIVRRVTRLLENGAVCREALDDVIDRCAALQNLRQAILQYRKSFNQQNLESPGRRAALNRGVEYLERYFLMIAFASYLGSDAFDEHGGIKHVPFKAWLHKRPEIRQMKWSMRLRPARVFAVPEVEFRTLSESSKGDEILEAIVKSRNGSVLGKRAILKLYHFPGQEKTNALDIPGALHMCKVDGFPIHSMATPTVQGAKAAFAYLNTAPDHAGRRAVVTDLREEAVVYIHGNPFVLRELDQPVSTLKHVGIKGSAVEQMERRLKEDILAELKRSGGRVVLHREEQNPLTGKSDIIGYWEIANLEDVQTPAEIYATLAAEGYKIDYKRIPLTRERAALPSDVDSIRERLNTFDTDVEYVYISHTGLGGVAYAMAITCLRLQAEANLANVVSPTSGNEFAYDNDQVDYRDVLSLVRVLANGPSCKAEVDAIIDKCAEAGNLRDDIAYYKHQLESCQAEDDDHRAYIQDMGVKALRRYLFLVAFRSYLGSSSEESSFAAWMNARPEIGHLCYNLKL